MSVQNLLGTDLNVSRETLERLEVFVRLLEKWNPKINLVAKSTLPEVWTRHIHDSAQVFDTVDVKGSWVDIGSGGGFPGIVCAILASEKQPDVQFSCIESDKRKCVFLRTAVRECGINCKIISDRIEHAEPQNANILTARALAELKDLLVFSERHLSRDGICVFQKGENWQKEVDNAKREWNFEYQTITSLTEPRAVLLRIEGVSRV